MSLSRRLFFGSVLGVGAATSLKVDAERQPEPIQTGDVLVLEHPGELGEDAYRNIQIAASNAIPGVKVLVLEEGMKARLLRPEAGELVASVDGRALAEEVVRHLPVVLQRQGL
jgi:hypothetical protein